MSRVRRLPPTGRGAENPDSASAARTPAEQGPELAAPPAGSPTRPGRPGEQKAGWGPRPLHPAAGPALTRRPQPSQTPSRGRSAGSAGPAHACRRTDGRTAPDSEAQLGPSAGPLAPPIVKGPAGRFRVQSQRRATRGPAAANRVSRYSGVRQNRPIRTRDTAGSGGTGQSALGAGPRFRSRPRCNARWRGLAVRSHPGLLAASSSPSAGSA